MPYAVNNVLKLVVTLRDFRFEGVFKNILHFRGYEGTKNTASMQAFIDAHCNDYFERYFSNLTDQTYLSHMKMENLTDLDEPAVEHLFANDDLRGVLDVNDDDVPQAAACITRKSFRRGRIGIGHVYFGPLPSYFTEEGLIIPDPLLFGDLTEVLDCLGDPLHHSEDGWEARPIVCNAAGTGVVANNDIRIQSVAPKTVYLKSRRPGVGE